MVIMVITGGKGTLIGPIIGGIIFGILPVGLREVAGREVQWIVYGIAMVLIVMFLPEGIVPGVQRLWERKLGSRADVRTRKQHAVARGQERRRACWRPGRHLGYVVRPSQG